MAILNETCTRRKAPFQGTFRGLLLVNLVTKRGTFAPFPTFLRKQIAAKYSKKWLLLKSCAKLSGDLCSTQL